MEGEAEKNMIYIVDFINLGAFQSSFVGAFTSQSDEIIAAWQGTS